MSWKEASCQTFFRKCLSTFLIAFSPQNVKNIVTFFPVAAAPLASTKVAKVLSRSSLNRMNVFPSSVVISLIAFSQEDAFSISTRYVPFADDFSRKWLPVLLHHASASRGKPASVACISRRSLGFRVSMLFFSFIIGPGH